ncbi:MAG: glycoside hydrolase family 3 C-terminal domain-containing protein [Clostridia bacterium]|nr:glycoside hydrolase family 3 C-terminal domain-containing protein [Clostridia bacterium]
MNGITEKLSVRRKAALVSGKTFWRTHGYKEDGVESIYFSDGPSGLRTQGGKDDCMGLNASQPSTCYPAHSALACSFNAKLVNKVGAAIGAEAAARGVDVLLAPAINIKRNPLNGRNFEYFSEDPYLSGVMGREYISGVQSNGVGACVKHFAANNKEYGRTVYDSAVDMRTLREIYLTPFEIAVKGANPVAVMTAYNRLNGIYCNENGWLLNTVLREEWGHCGIVVSDWGGTFSRIAAIKAGADLEMPCCKFSADEILNAIDNGELKEEELNACAERIISLAERLHGNNRTAGCDLEGNAAFAEECAEECAVLLKNDGALPVNRNEKFVLIGDFAKSPAYQGGGSSRVNPTRVATLFDCMRGEENFIGFERGYDLNGKKSNRLIKRALKLAASADTVICAVGLAAGDAEGVDRENIRLPENQIELLTALKSAGKRVVAILSCGGAVETDWDDGVNALLFAGLNGQGGAIAVKKILTGEVNPSGKLAESFPVKVEDVPSTQYLGDAYRAEYKEGMRVGYRGLKNVKYPFGFGLSYTGFEYSDLSVGDGASFTVKNTGGRDGAEAVQLYISFPESANAPFIQLKGFTKVFLRAGESARAEIPFDEYSFRSFDIKSNKWVTVKGTYKIFIGSSSDDLRLVGEKEISGADGVPAEECWSVTAKEYEIPRNKKGRVIASFETPFSELTNAKGALSRLAVKVALAVTKRSPTAGGTVKFVTLRTAAQFAKFDGVRAEGLIDIFGGRYFKGLKKIIRGEKKKK